jgi:OOP family OmpA-OmpF porin
MAGLALAVVLLAPSVGQAEWVKKVNGWEILADLSGSMTKGWKQGECGNMSKFAAQKKLLLKTNEAIPEFDYNGAFRRFGFKYYIAGPDDWSRLVWGPAMYDKAALAEGIQAQGKTQGITPLGPAIRHADNELSAWSGPKALVIFSDFHKDPDFGQPVEESAKLNEKYGEDLCVYMVNFSTEEADIAVAQGVVDAAACGKYYEGCMLLTDDAAFDQFIEDVWMMESGCIDEDGDGVCDEIDKCPNTPRGAMVDERGCWVAAYDSFFDFDKAVVKPQYFGEIQNAADTLKENPDLYVTLVGHTDSVGTEEYNYGLGLRRAKAVEKKLVEYGVNPGRIRVESMGELNPTYPNDTPANRAKNRRVDIVIYEPK